MMPTQAAPNEPITWQSASWQNPGGFPPPPSYFVPRPRRLRIALIIGVLVVAVLAVIAAVIINGSSGGKKAQNASDAVTGYLGALARGDARAALSFGKDEPADKQFLTDQILKKQTAKWPITNIRILSTETLSKGSEYVHVAVNFGEHTSDQTMSVREYGREGWKLKSGALKVKFLAGSHSQALSTLTLFDEQLDGNHDTYIFPGAVEFGNSNPNITQRAQDYPLLLNQMSTWATLGMYYDVSDSGKAAATGAVKAAVAQCAKSTQLKPPNCPQLVREPDLVDGTAQWTAPTDFSALHLGLFDPDRMSVPVRGDLDFHLTAKSTSGADKSGWVKDYLSATADLTKSPPTITFASR